MARRHFTCLHTDTYEEPILTGRKLADIRAPWYIMYDKTNVVIIADLLSRGLWSPRASWFHPWLSLVGGHESCVGYNGLLVLRI